jgi:hypothetical protein
MANRLKTWHLEAAFDAVLLGGVVLTTEPFSAVSWLGALAVWLSARHASVADRLREAEEERQAQFIAFRAFQRKEHELDGVRLPPERPGTDAIHCVAWLDRYWVVKEICWISYFIALGAWPALVGALRFLVWPWWRRLYRRWRPRGRQRQALGGGHGEA